MLKELPASERAHCPLKIAKYELGNIVPSVPIPSSNCYPKWAWTLQSIRSPLMGHGGHIL